MESMGLSENARGGCRPFCTLTGVDEGTDLSRLLDVSGELPFAEWGVLISHVQAGKGGRYPSLDWIGRLVGLLVEPGKANFALHVCGKRAVGELLSGKGAAFEFASHFPRVQINFRSADWELGDIRAAISGSPGRVVITQANRANEGLWERLSDLPNHAVLFDASGGRGESPEGWP